MFLTRRQFMKASAGTMAALAIADKALALTALQPVIEVGNPLGEYPDRSWERVYHDQYRYDSSFTYICTPNDTHACRVRAFVRNGVVMRVEQNYDHQTYEDLYGNRGTFAWNPRMCLKGYTFHRRVYGPYRLKGPMLRKGWKAWVDDGCPELSPEVKAKYRFTSRGEDDMLRVSWDTMGTYLAKAHIKIAERYSGEAGARRPHRGHRARVQPARDEGRLLDSGPARVGCLPLSGGHQGPHGREPVRCGLLQAVHGQSDPDPDRHTAVPGSAGRDQRL